MLVSASQIIYSPQCLRGISVNSLKRNFYYRLYKLNFELQILPVFLSILYLLGISNKIIKKNVFSY